MRDLGDSNRVRFQAAARIATTSIVSGRPPANRWQRVRGSRRPLYELKITPPGSPGPQLRMICGRQGDRVLLLRGVRKKSRALPRSDIEAAERALS